MTETWSYKWVYGDTYDTLLSPDGAESVVHLPDDGGALPILRTRTYEKVRLADQAICRVAAAIKSQSPGKDIPAAFLAEAVTEAVQKGRRQ